MNRVIPFVLAASIASAQEHNPGQALTAGSGIHAEARTEKGRPFSAIVVTRTEQTFFDGTHVNRTTTTFEYRDFDGRVRTETALPNGGIANIVIRDPVAGVLYRIDPAAKSVVKERLSPAVAGGFHETGVGHSGYHSNEMVEDLGSSNINGINVHGTRVTIIVPVGAIGNDREFRSSYEHWFSPEMNMIVKSISIDPRFGATTYEMTNIKREPPAPALFQPPSNYTEVR